MVRRAQRAERWEEREATKEETEEEEEGSEEEEAEEDEGTGMSTLCSWEDNGSVDE